MKSHKIPHSITIFHQRSPFDFQFATKLRRPNGTGIARLARRLEAKSSWIASHRIVPTRNPSTGALGHGWAMAGPWLEIRNSMVHVMKLELHYEVITVITYL